MSKLLIYLIKFYNFVFNFFKEKYIDKENKKNWIKLEYKFLVTLYVIL